MDETEGIYVRDIKTGKVRAVVGQTYMLTENEELWEKFLPGHIQELIDSGIDPVSDRHANQRRPNKSNKRVAEAGADEYFIPPKARCVTLEVPHNAAVQLYDYKSKNARVVFGPDLVLLDPDEQFTVLSLSGLELKIVLHGKLHF